MEADQLRVLSPEERRGVLIEGSGLPGPRANLPLARAAAAALDVEEALALARDDDEYLALCGATALGLHAVDAGVLPALRDAAQDPRWRVREGVATGLQLLAAQEPVVFRAVLEVWRADEDPLVQRARIAAACEPPLLKDPELAAFALDACRRATAVLVGLPAGIRRSTDGRVLRQALGWCWSVAIAADPAAGLPELRALERDLDPDVAWIVRSTRAKARISRLVQTTGERAGPAAVQEAPVGRRYRRARG